ncbi:copper-binding protein [Sphingosinicella sp.]|jgi:Cu/Ag efflux protein CusF|uniref:copper-binding protein n=1 Tax=Sphingosinicella sp. TaxID=1917971 RepID=UPI0017BAC087|nr:copper-binding protein [Sphingosinicella sp.]
MNVKSIHILTGSFLLLVAVSACSPEADKQKTTAPKDAAADAPASVVQHGKGEGKITAIDEAKGTVTLDHGEIAALKWPPMAMGFEAPADLLKGLKVGDRVAFELDWNGATGRITRIEALPAS